MENFVGICLSNKKTLFEQWNNCIKTICLRSVPRKNQHRSQLSPLVSHTSSNTIIRLQTARRNQHQIQNQVTIHMLQSSSEDNLAKDRATFEQLLTDSRLTNHLFKYFRTFHSTQFPLFTKYQNEKARRPKS